MIGSQFLPGYKITQIPMKYSKLIKKEHIQTWPKIETLDSYHFLKPTILKYGPFKYYRKKAGKNRSYFQCGARRKGCKVCIAVLNNRPTFISCFDHNHG